MRRNPCPAFLGRPPGVPGQPGGLGLELRVQSPRLLCVITEDIPVEQEEHGPETCHLVTYFCSVSLHRQGQPDEVERTGALEGGRSELESWHLPLGCGAGRAAFLLASVFSPVKGEGCTTPSRAAVWVDSVPRCTKVPSGQLMVEKCSFSFLLLIPPPLKESQSALRN